MPQIRQDFDGQTVICTFEVTPGSAHDVLDLLQAAYAEVISHQPGYISGAIHLNDAQTRICTYSQWGARSDYQAMLRTGEMRQRNRAIHGLVRGFEPVMYEVASVVASPGANT
ncbi:antibiotic biosynthesis monooxygenase [Paracoccus suum]|uniref:Antibiotic biosynthesis monooxygenase n=1 Tax=Paracoccus suum TaxID=2259340 RepID=A0A344PMW0_9RHOB|nr:antibiotic biosynthesis monooxygenase [Paracoccus suum]AXC50715.1 antibiotic biosynthesis monooxygenase [Paracoccus suum]